MPNGRRTKTRPKMKKEDRNKIRAKAKETRKGFPFSSSTSSPPSPFARSAKFPRRSPAVKSPAEPAPLPRPRAAAAAAAAACRAEGISLPLPAIQSASLSLSLSSGLLASFLEEKAVLSNLIDGAQMSRTNVIGSGRRRILLCFSFWV
ncbi:hypothetical protein NL676_026423 [Syzygium grande]|nr:hypothetical protein NL676_026423 [Syzygium grande]